MTTTMEQINKAVEKGLATEWTHPRTGAKRYYLNRDSLVALIGLEMDYYKTGNVCNCEYTYRGEKYRTSNRCAYHNWMKIYFDEDGELHSDFNYDHVEDAIIEGVNAL